MKKSVGDMIFVNAENSDLFVKYVYLYRKSNKTTFYVTFWGKRQMSRLKQVFNKGISEMKVSQNKLLIEKVVLKIMAQCQELTYLYFNKQATPSSEHFENL